MKKVTKGARIAAIVCVVLLLGMYVATFIAALAAKPYSNGMFLGCVLCTVFVPIFLHILIRMFAMMSERKEGDVTLHELHKARKKEREEHAREALEDEAGQREAGTKGGENS